MMGKNPRRHSAACKFRVALELVLGSKTTVKPSCEHEIHANMIEARKRQMLEDGLTDPGPAVHGRSHHYPLAANIRVGMDAGGRALENVFCERLWLNVKHEIIYLNRYDTVPHRQSGMTAQFDSYNHKRPPRSPQHRTPAELHFVLWSEHNAST